MRNYYREGFIAVQGFVAGFGTAMVICMVFG